MKVKIMKKALVFFVMAVVIAGAFSATTVNALPTDSYVGQIGTREVIRHGKYLVLGAFGKYTYVASDDSDHKSSYKLAKCTAYKYIKKQDKYVSCSTKKAQGKNKSVMTEYINYNGSVAKIEYYGEIYRTSEDTSGVLEKGKTRIYRTGCPVK